MIDSTSHIRVARPSRDLASTERFYIGAAWPCEQTSSPSPTRRASTWRGGLRVCGPVGRPHALPYKAAPTRKPTARKTFHEGASAQKTAAAAQRVLNGRLGGRLARGVVRVDGPGAFLSRDEESCGSAGTPAG